MTRKQCFIFLLFLLLLSFILQMRAHDCVAPRINIEDFILIDYELDDFGQVDGLASELAVQEQPPSSFFSDFMSSDVYANEQLDTRAVIKRPALPPIKSASLWCSVGVPVVATVGGIACIAVAGGFALNHWAERYITNDILSKYDKSLSTISQIDKKLLHAAYILDHKGLARMLDDLIARYGIRVLTGKKRTWLLPALAELYYDNSPTPEVMQDMCNLLSIML